MSKLSIIIPAYNEEKRIEKTLISYSEFLREKVKNKELAGFEIIVVLNNCSDNTLGITKKIKGKFNEIKILDFERGGKGFAIIEGFKDSLKRDSDLIGFVDADMATSPQSFFDLVKNIRNYDGIIASRALKQSRANFSLKRKITHKGFNFVVRSFFLFRFRDTQCGAKLFKRIVLQKITPELSLTEWAFDVNLLYLCKKRKYKVKEFPTIWQDKEESKLNLIKAPLQMFSGVLRLRLIFSPFENILGPLKFLQKIWFNLFHKQI